LVLPPSPKEKATMRIRLFENYSFVITFRVMTPSLAREGYNVDKIIKEFPLLSARNVPTLSPKGKQD
jgi:hypothetical protein